MVQYSICNNQGVILNRSEVRFYNIFTFLVSYNSSLVDLCVQNRD